MTPRPSSGSPDSAGRSAVPGALLAAALIAAVLLGTSPARAFDMNSDAPISVNADQARLDDSAGQATYTGNVVVVQAETRLTADRVELYRDAQGLSRIIAFGEPAHYAQAQTPENPATDARAREIEFDAADSLLMFRRQAVIEQAGDVFRGDQIQYDTEQRVVTAERDPAAEGSRVETIIQPRRQQQDSGNPGAD